MNTNASLYGKGVFTTVAVFNRRPFLWEKHWHRLSESTLRLEIDISGHDSRSVSDSLAEAIDSANIINGRARITFLDETPSKIWEDVVESETRLSITTANLRSRAENQNVTLSPHLVNSTSPLAGIKSCNYLEPLMCHDEAKSRGFDEAIRLNERSEITSASMANVFWLKGGRLFTPSLTTGCLAGTTREFVLENLECEEVEAGVDAIRDADEIFLTSAGIGVVQAVEFEGRRLKSTDHLITKILPF